MGWEVGKLLAGKYRVERVVGRGGMGVVLAVTHLELGERFAVKVLEEIDRHGGERLLREARAAVRLRGEHIVRVHDVGRLEDGQPYLVLELVPGRSLAEELAANGPFDDAATAEVLLQACVALAEAHGKGLVHRDVKPSNLLVASRPDGSRIIKLIDFGIAKLADHEDDVRLTARSAPLGSPRYMAPEQIRDAHGVDARADVWALGVLAHELRTGSPPFAAFTTGGLLASIIADEPRPLPADVASALQVVIAGCLVKDIDKRFADVTAVAAGLASLLTDGDRWAERVARTFAAATNETNHAGVGAEPTEAAGAMRETPGGRGATTTTPPAATVTTYEPTARSEPPTAPTPRPSPTSPAQLDETAEELPRPDPSRRGPLGRRRAAATALGLLLAIGLGWTLRPTPAAPASPASPTSRQSPEEAGAEARTAPTDSALPTTREALPTGASAAVGATFADNDEHVDKELTRPPAGPLTRGGAATTRPSAVVSAFSSAGAAARVPAGSTGDDFDRFGGRK
jgi:eukaryotic-like serine/threonine-protein kinase